MCAPSPSVRRPLACGYRVVLLVMLCFATLIGLSLTGAYDVGEFLTKFTIRLSLAWYAAGLVLMIGLERPDWQASTFRGRFARQCWILGALSFLLHFAAAFHFYHGWSHAHAFERTRLVSGVGAGIYASYLFTLIWTVDAFWWYVRPASYAARPLWLGRAVHLLMLFMVFNATIVFESGLVRWTGIVLFVVLTALWVSFVGVRLQRA